jgi:hypothetical protein
MMLQYLMLLSFILFKARNCAKSLKNGNPRNSSYFASTFVAADPFPTKIYAYYFPQFHEEPLNNVIWGKGYTDWENLKKTSSSLNRYGVPLQHPHDDIGGYYDLSHYKTRKIQADLARKYGIDGFLYHHYWFYHHNESAILAKPLLMMLQDGEPNVSFALSWASASWVGTW